ncbi:hypothetical protein WN943_001199 [Citrus x changshan-huyou]
METLKAQLKERAKIDFTEKESLKQSLKAEHQIKYDEGSLLGSEYALEVILEKYPQLDLSS